MRGEERSIEGSRPGIRAPRGREPRAPERANGALVAAIVVACAGFAAARSILAGASAAELARAWGFVLLHAWLPGWLAWSALRPQRDTLLARIAFGAALGHALQVLAYLACELAGARALVAFWPLVCMPLVWAAWSATQRRSEERVARALGTRHALALGLVLAFVVARSPLTPAGAWWSSFDFDTLFHTGNTASLRVGLPLTDPRVGGIPYNYHHFAYALAAAARDVAHVPLADAYERLFPALWPLLLTLCVFELARACASSANDERVRARSATVAMIAAALVALHGELGLHFARIVGGAARWSAQSYFEFGVYHSPSSVLGLVFFAAAALLCLELLRDERATTAPARSSIGTWTALALLALAASGTKGSVVPVLLAATGACALLATFQRLPSARAWGVVAAIALPAAPMTLSLSLGEGRLSDAVLRVAPWHAFYTSPLFDTLARAVWTDGAHAPRWFEWVLAPAWLALFFAGASVGVLAMRPFRGGVSSRWLTAAVVAGVLPVALLGGQGHAQLFFAYSAEVALAVLAGCALAAAPSLKAPRVVIAVLLGAGALLAGGIHAAMNVRRDLREVEPEPPLLRAQREGLEWLREHTPLDAVVLSRPWLPLVSARAERRAFYETDSETPASFAISWEEVGGRWRKTVPARIAYEQRASIAVLFTQHPDVATLRMARAELGFDVELYALVDHMHVTAKAQRGRRWEVDPVGDLRLDGDGAELVFENEAVRIYRATR